MENQHSDFVDYWMAERRENLHQNLARHQKRYERNQARAQRELRKKRRCLLVAMLLFVLAVMWGLAPKAVGGSSETIDPKNNIPALVIEESEEIPGEHTVAVMPEPAWFREDLPLEVELQEALYDACLEFGTYYEVMLALIDRETDFRNVTGDSGESFGYCQIQPQWWGDLMEEIGVTDLMYPEQNLRCGCAILAYLVSEYGELEEALTAYNTGGPGKSEYASSILAEAEKWR